MTGDGPRRILGAQVLDVLGDELHPRRCPRAFTMLTTRARQFEQSSQVHVGCGTLGDGPPWPHFMSCERILRVQVLDCPSALIRIPKEAGCHTGR